MLELTGFEGLLRVVRNIGADQAENLLPEAVLEGSALLNPDDLVFGESGLFFVDVTGAVARVIVHIADKDLMHMRNRPGLHVIGSAVEDAEFIEKFHRFHLFNCQTLQQAALEGWRDKYRVSRKKSGFFHYRIISRNHVVGEYENQRLFLCKNCRNLLDRSCFRRRLPLEKWPSFNLETFLDLNIQHDCIEGTFQAAEASSPNIYSKDWGEISTRYKQKTGWQCENSGCPAPDLSPNYLKEYLHVHHRNRQKSEVSSQYLKAVCIKCHAKEPGHGHMKALPQYRKFKNIRLV